MSTRCRCGRRLTYLSEMKTGLCYSCQDIAMDPAPRLPPDRDTWPRIPTYWWDRFFNWVMK